MAVQEKRGSVGKERGTDLTREEEKVGFRGRILHPH